MNKAYPIYTFDIAMDEVEVTFIRDIISKKDTCDDSKRKVYDTYMLNYMSKIREIMKSSGHQELKERLDNYIGIYVKYNSKEEIGVVIFDAKKKSNDSIANILFEDNGKGKIPYILVD